MEHPFVLVIIIATILNVTNIWYMIKSRYKHNQCVKNRKCKKKSNLLYTDPERSTRKKEDPKMESYYLKAFGVYETKHFPLESFGSRQYKKPLYTIQQLAAIELMVDCFFENLC